MSARRTSLPISLPGATEFTSEPEVLNELWAIEALKQQPQWLTPLVEETEALQSNFGRPRVEGSWALAYLAFVVSGRVDIEPWWNQSFEQVWTASGFQAKPSYQTTWSRFTELEEAAEAFSKVVTLLVQQAQRHTNGLVGRDLHVDATEAETHSRLVHDCQPREKCNKGPKYLKRATNAEVREVRHKHSAKPPIDELDIGDAEEIKEDEQGRVRLKSAGCWYRTLDSSAGVRSYKTKAGKTKKFWHGFYNMKAIDHYTGAPVSIHIFSASIQEWNGYPALLEQTLNTLGEGNEPRSIVADRGLSVSSVFEMNTRHGVASVMPFRKPVNGPHRGVPRDDRDTDEYDRHGVPRCKHCGGPTRYHNFDAKQKGSPRLWFNCQLPKTDECRKGPQSIVCSKDWTILLPLWRTEEAYFALKESHDAYERVHHLFRSRYRVGADNHALRPKRIGLPWQQLRANAALLVEWLRIIHREGWLGSARRQGREVRSRERVHHGLGWRKFLRFRTRTGLNRPYGPKALALGLTGPSSPEEMALPPPGDKDDRPF
jgi:hypothetical protein